MYKTWFCIKLLQSEANAKLMQNVVLQALQRNARKYIQFLKSVKLSIVPESCFTPNLDTNHYTITPFFRTFQPCNCRERLKRCSTTSFYFSLLYNLFLRKSKRFSTRILCLDTLRAQQSCAHAARCIYSVPVFVL